MNCVCVCVWCGVCVYVCVVFVQGGVCMLSLCVVCGVCVVFVCVWYVMYVYICFVYMVSVFIYDMHVRCLYDIYMCVTCVCVTFV